MFKKLKPVRQENRFKRRNANKQKREIETLSGYWQPFKEESEIEQESSEVTQSLEAETDDSETDAKRDSRFRRRID